MQKIKFNLLFCMMVMLQACASLTSGHFDTTYPTAIDGGWLETKCTCAGKDDLSADLQSAHVLFINGNKLFQGQIGRWKKPEWIRYCSLHEEASINPISDNIFNVTTTSERTFSSGDTKCDTSMNSSKRTWKILTINKSELKYESTSGCSSGPLTCSFKRLDQ